MSDVDVENAVLAARVVQHIKQNAPLYRRGIEWWNAEHSQSSYRKKLAKERRERRKSGKWPRPEGYPTRQAENRADYIDVRRFRIAMNTFPQDKSEWRRLDVDRPAQILLITAMIAGNDFDPREVGLDEPAAWCDGKVRPSATGFGRDSADMGLFPLWNDQDGPNGLWWKLANAAWKVMQVREGAKAQGKAPIGVPSDAELNTVLERLGAGWEDNKYHSWPQFLKHGVTDQMLRQAKCKGALVAEKGPKGNLYLVRDVVRHWYLRFKA